MNEYLQKQLKKAKKDGINVLPIGHHNLLAQSRMYTTQCAMNNNGDVIELFQKYELPLYLSGHLHVQRIRKHKAEPGAADDSYGIMEIVTDALSIPPCQYALLEWKRDGSMEYSTKAVDVSAWAARTGSQNPDLLDFEGWSERYIQKLIIDQIRGVVKNLGNDVEHSMAEVYASVYIDYYAGRRIDAKGIRSSKGYRWWERNMPDSYLLKELAARTEALRAADPHAFSDHVLRPSPDRITHLGVARTFQNIRLFSALTVFENVLIAKHMRAKQNVFSATFRFNRAEEKRMQEEAMALLEEQDLPPESREYASALEHQAEKLRFLIDALVKTSRLESGVLAMTPKRHGIQQLLDAASAQAAPGAEAKAITLTVEPTDLTARFDPKWTAEALYNLVDNAVKYTPAGGAVTLRAVGYELFCRVDVTDTGPGIPESEQARIFQRFYRSPSASEAEGVGIGLYLARQIAAGQGGYLKVSSRPGEGSTFSLFLPRAEERT